ncbi:MAG: type II secretion system protein N [Pigmentiphaga sp.]
MMARWSRQLFLALVLVLIAILAAIAVMPARWLIAVLPASWPVAVVDASGSLWRGTALVALGPPGARTTLPAPVGWHLDWQSGPRLQLQHPWLDCQLGLRPGLTALGLSPCTLRLPAAALATLGAPLNTLKPAGQLSLRWPGLRLPYRSLPAAGEVMQLDWTQAGSALSNVRPLGHYRVTLASTGQRLEIALATISGPLVLEGTGNLDPRGGFNFRGEARPAPDTAVSTVAGLQTLLSGIGRRSGEATLLQVGRL